VAFSRWSTLCTTSIRPASGNFGDDFGGAEAGRKMRSRVSAWLNAPLLLSSAMPNSIARCGIFWHVDSAPSSAISITTCIALVVGVQADFAPGGLPWLRRCSAGSMP